MTQLVINGEVKKKLQKFFSSVRNPELVSSYLHYIGLVHNIQPVVFPVGKIIFRNEKEAIEVLESQGNLWKETEIKIRFGQRSVNEDTKKIYICPFTGKVFGNNTHPNPQDAIYDWVSSCSENTEKIDGLRVKRFFVSEDPEVIKNFITERTQTIKKTVFSSVINGKLFNSKQAIITDFKQKYIKLISLIEVQNQNRFEIEDRFLAFLQEQLDESKISIFLEALAQVDEFIPYVETWIDSEEED